VPRLVILLAFLSSIACARPTYFGHAPGDDWGVSVHGADPFFPAWIDVGVGATVRWTNYGSTPQILHSGTPAQPTPVFVAWIAPGASFSYTFSLGGSFEFFLRGHPEVQGKVTIR
jgi:plastocyanin